jgi:uncharacterized small protein (DUF1192 family)
MDDLEPLRQSGTIAIGDDLYGLSIGELEQRVTLFETEITRVKRELEKKTQDLNAADSLFRPKN